MMQICIFIVDQYHVCYDDDWLRIALENELHKATKSNLFCLIFSDKLTISLKLYTRCDAKSKNTTTIANDLFSQYF